jgi:hypothetical protein
MTERQPSARWIAITAIAVLAAIVVLVTFLRARPLSGFRRAPAAATSAAPSP